VARKLQRNRASSQSLFRFESAHRRVVRERTNAMVMENTSGIATGLGAELR
jgi:hypothetical protein